MSKCRLYAWGANSHGQLGLGFQSEQSTQPQEVNLSSIGLNPKDIKKIIGGAGHTLILDKKGRVYSCGWNNKGQTGHITIDSKKVNENLQMIKSLENEEITDVACGWDGSMALTKEGYVFLWGSNRYGQLGKNEKSINRDYSNEPQKIIEIGDRIKGVAMGLRHSAVITDGGKVFVAGAGNKSQLGLVDNENKAIPSVNAFTEIPGLTDVVEIACGQNHTVVITKSNNLCVWGDNRHGQLGFDNTLVRRINCPKKFNEVDDIGELMELRVGWTHTSVLNANGTIYSWGRNSYGQLGRQEEENIFSWTPNSVNCLKKIRQLSVGSEHNVALAEDGTILSWGWNEHGNCGNGNTQDVLVPEEIRISRDAKGILVGSGAGHSFAIVSKD